MSVPVCVSVCVIRTAENSRNIAPVTCCIILSARGDSPGWFISMERCLPVFEESKIEQYKACQGKKNKKSVFPPHTLHCNGGIAASLSAWLTWLIFFCNPQKIKIMGGTFIFEVVVVRDLGVSQIVLPLDAQRRQRPPLCMRRVHWNQLCQSPVFPWIPGKRQEKKRDSKESRSCAGRQLCRQAALQKHHRKRL